MSTGITEEGTSLRATGPTMAPIVFDTTIPPLYKEVQMKYHGLFYNVNVSTPSIWTFLPLIAGCGGCFISPSYPSNQGIDRLYLLFWSRDTDHHSFRVGP